MKHITIAFEDKLHRKIQALIKANKVKSFQDAVVKALNLYLNDNKTLVKQQQKQDSCVRIKNKIQVNNSYTRIEEKPLQNNDFNYSHFEPQLQDFIDNNQIQEALDWKTSIQNMENDSGKKGISNQDDKGRSHIQTCKKTPQGTL